MGGWDFPPLPTELNLSLNIKWFFMEGLLANEDVESTSNLRRIYVESEFTSNLRRIYVEFTSNRGQEKPWAVFRGA